MQGSNRDAEITNLTKLWYEIIGLDHHKDSDCHWYINKVWSYGGAPVYRFEHYGYTYGEIITETCKSYKKAESALVTHLKKAIEIEIGFAKEVSGDKKDTWSGSDVKIAKDKIKIWEEYEKRLG